MRGCKKEVGLKDDIFSVLKPRRLVLVCVLGCACQRRAYFLQTLDDKDEDDYSP